jgi:uncharacterized protein (DUF362 family)
MKGLLSESTRRGGFGAAGGGRSFATSAAGGPKVGLTKGNDRKENLWRALRLIEDDIFASIGDRQVLIKPNFVQINRQLAATPVESVRIILEFLRTRHKKQILIGESTQFQNGTLEGYKNYGYLPLEKEYKIKPLDLNLMGSQRRYVVGEKFKPQAIRICAPFFDPNLYVISAALLKTHQYAVASMSIKNVVMGSPLNDYNAQVNDKKLMHRGPHGDYNDILHFNLFQIGQEVFPNLAVIDGFEGMEGQGPSNGTPIDSRVVIASVDALAADTVGAKVMGFDPKKILYLASMAEAGMGQGDIARMNLSGDRVEECIKPFKAPPSLRFSAV